MWIRDPLTILTQTPFSGSTEALLWFRSFTVLYSFSCMLSYPSGVHPSRLMYLF